jgi:putative tricarboxylic transport membrane protein
MSIRGQIFAAMCLFVLFAAYGLQATTIPMFPGQEYEPFKPRTMPMILAMAGLLLCVVRIFQLWRMPQPESTVVLAEFDWKSASLLCAVMLAYGFAMTPLGFVAATSLFLAAGFFILGERRLWLLTGLPLLFSLAFYLLMTRVLGLYLSSGLWWNV